MCPSLRSAPGLLTRALRTRRGSLQASCTLDAGVKIYASRVDSVHSETFKVLGGLSRSAAPRAEAAEGEEGDDGDDGDAEGDGEEGAGGSKEPARGRARKGDDKRALEPADAHTSRALEAAVAVDPLFQKTSAQFDEGGAAGLLMNTLAVHRGCDTVFDSGEVPDFAGTTAARGAVPLSGLTLDLSALAPALAAATAALAAPAGPLRLTPTLSAVRALIPGGATDNTTAPGATDDAGAAAPPSALRDLWAEGGMFATAVPAADDANAATAAAFEDDMYNGADYGDGDYGGAMDDADECGGADGTAGFGFRAAASMLAEHGDAAAAPALAGRFQMGDGGVLQWVAAAADAAGAQPRRAWAGASHWRFRAAPAAPAADGEGAPAPVTTARKGAKKGPFFIDFTAPLPALEPALFAPPAKASDTLLAGVPAPADTLLPADLRYTAAQLVRLFLKPNAALARGPDGANLDAGAAVGDSADADGFRDDDTGAMDGDDDCGYGGFDGGNSWDAGVHTLAPGTDGGSSLVEAPRRVEQIRVNYARSAKVVDVRALKAALWDGLEREAPASNATKPAPPVSFAHLLQSVTPDCGAGAVSDLSVHMCFICVLHLANEHGLAISGVKDLDEMRITHPVRSLAT